MRSSKLHGPVTALLVAFVLAALSLSFASFAVPLPIYLEVAQGLAAGRGVITNYPPFGYSLFLACAIRVAGLDGVFFAQALLYVATVMLAYFLIASVTPDRRFALIGSIAVAIHPQLLLNIKRITDSNLDVPALLAVTLLMPATLRSRSVVIAIWCGLILGYMAEVRSNFALLAMGFALVLLWRRQFAEFGALVGVAVAMVIALSISIMPTLQFHLRGYGGYGAYTFACGNNPTSLNSLMDQENCETDRFGNFIKGQLNIPSGLPSEHPIYEWSQTHSGDFYGVAFAFIRQHPVTFVELIGVKTFTFFRPDFRRLNLSSLAQGWLMAAIQIVLALPFPLWVITRVVLRNKVGWMNGLATIPIAAIYVVPFILASADPRYRLPLDVLMIADIFASAAIAAGYESQAFGRRLRTKRGRASSLSSGRGVESSGAASGWSGA